MFNLNKTEIFLMALLSFSLILGFGAKLYNTARKPVEIGIKNIGENLPMKDIDALIEDRSIVRINEATKEELMRLKGVGEALAGRIADYRRSHGRFGSISDLKRVKGIGEKIYEDIKDRITAE